MFDKYFEIIKVILPPIITGLMGFWLAKQRNDDLSNMKVSYSRVYFPIYKYITLNSNIGIEQLTEYSNIYIEKYFKYIDNSTYNCFKKLKDKKNDKTFNEFKNNIVQINSYLRRRLNYLESNSFSTYSFSTNDQKLINMVISIMIMYILAFASKYFNNILPLSFVFIFCSFAFFVITIILVFQLLKNLF